MTLPADHPVRRAVRTFAADRERSERWVIGVSGGADSLALAAAALAERGPDRLTAVTIDHQLQAGSALQAQRCRDLLQHWGFRDARIEVVSVGRRGGPEAAARDARRTALETVAAGDPILLAHTMDDQAESVLLGLARGSGPRSIAGMQVWRSPYARPLLSVRRADTENACAALGVAPWPDPHNVDPRYTRVRIRREVLPLLDEVLGGGVSGALARTADLLADDLSALDDWAHREYLARRTGPLPDPRLALHEFAQLPGAIRRRILRLWLAEQAIPPTAEHLRALDRLAMEPHAGQRIRLPGARDACAAGNDLTLEAVAPRQ